MRNDSTNIVAIGSLKPYGLRLCVHSKKNLKKLKLLVEKYGQVLPIVVDPQGCIIDGHALWSVLCELKYDEVRVVTVSGCDDTEIRALRLALNRLPQEAKWDGENLRSEFRALVDLSFDLDLTGFDAPEIDLMLEIDIPKANVVEDEDIPELQAPVNTVGDIWQLGRHRVGCCDALEEKSIADLMNGVKATMVFTDPPYNVPIDGFVSGMGKVSHSEFVQASGEMSSAEFRVFLQNACAQLTLHVADGSLIYLCMDWRHMAELSSAGADAGLHLENLCIWAKTNAGMGSLYRSQHELVFVFRNGVGEHLNNVELGKHGRNRSNLWTYRGMNSFGAGRDKLLASHPTVKPVLMIADAIRDVTKRGDIVLDTFLGSGSTLMAAEETGRICYGSDLDPQYVDVAIRRWQCRTGKDAVHIASGETFEERESRLSAAVGAGDHVS